MHYLLFFVDKEHCTEKAIILEENLMKCIIVIYWYISNDHIKKEKREELFCLTVKVKIYNHFFSFLLS